ncbi:sushi, von Willebrand factor type A, EGF and pentraxin domain-containing protein 1-like [Bolinopsis microptera]|uniref:sushi, von Willebrand factor type A, EGF and pentraxin domain-containing protein 1-like n=1 Tax=Bolinopsis microptera TaxID=2820187 RepID=UPI003079AE20
MSNCHRCPAAQFTSSAGSASCVECEAGQTPNSERSACVACPVGKYRSGTMIQCELCPAGSMSKVAGQSECSSCGPNGVSSAAGSTMCKGCGDGTVPTSDFTDCVPCPAGTKQSGNVQECSSCGPNGVSSAGSAMCMGCGDGRVPNSDFSACVPCPAGTKQFGNVQECSSCGPNGVSSAGSAMCMGCGDGRVPNSDFSACVPCPAGTKQFGNVQECSSCGPNGVSSAGSAVCGACGPGTVPNSDFSACEQCPAGTKKFGDDQECSSCGPNGVSSAAGSTMCMWCGDGNVPNSDFTDCVPCPAGTKQSGNVQECSSCGPNGVSSTGSAMCMGCGDGRVPNSDFSACVPCKGGTYKDTSMQVCKPCGANHYSAEGAGICIQCPVFSAASEDKTECVSCSGLPQTYTNMLSSERFPVPPGTVVTITCEQGHSHVAGGAGLVTCVRDRVFDVDGNFKCDKGVPNIPNLTSPGTEFPVEYGSLVTVTCQSGSSLQGDGVITCQSGTEFVHEAEPSCVEKRCTGLPPHIDHITTTTSFPTAHSTVVTVLCDPASGAQLRGDSSITCDDTTSFTFEETPRCNEQGKCTELPPNRYLATNIIFPVPAGTQIMVMCETGTTHTLGDSVVTCVTDDQYTFQQSMPTCSIDTCSDLPDIYNLITDTPFPVDYGTTVRVSCLARYTLVGDDAITCVKGRTFLVENAMPGCQLDECTELPNLPNIKTNTTFPVVVGTVVELWCIPGYTLQGDSQITCLNGKEYLISSPPSCQIDTCNELLFVDDLQTNATFPLLYGTPVTVSCDSDTLTLLGSEVIFCEVGTTYQFLSLPRCVDKGNCPAGTYFKEDDRVVTDPPYDSGGGDYSGGGGDYSGGGGSVNGGGGGSYSGYCEICQVSTERKSGSNENGNSIRNYDDSDNPVKDWDAYKDRIVWKFENKQDHWITKLTTAKIKASNRISGSSESYHTRVALLGKIGSTFYIICEHHLSGTQTLKDFYINGKNEQEERWDRQLVAFDEIQMVSPAKQDATVIKYLDQEVMFALRVLVCWMACPVGKYRSGTMTQCELCPAGSISKVAGQSECSSCGNGKMSNPDRTDCEQCPAGTKKYGSEQECSSCGPNGVSSAAGSFICMSCGDGNVPNSDFTDCVPCPAGTKQFGNVQECSSCGPNGVSSAAGSTMCMWCGDGNVPNSDFTDCEQCPAGTKKFGNDQECSSCGPNGVSSAAGSTMCMSCGDGNVPNSDFTDCVPCPAGTKQFGRVQECSSCGPNGVSSAGSAACGVCGDGTVPNSDFSACVPCPAGTKKFGNVQECSSCGPNGVSSAGSAICMWCGDGRVPNSDFSACDTCPEGRYRDSTMTECVVCGKVGEEPSSGLNSCVLCKGGTYKDTSMQVCKPCEANHYSAEGAGICIQCPVFSAASEDKTECVSCSGLPQTYTNMLPSETFPVPPGTVVTLTCEQGHSHVAGGAGLVTCVRDRVFDGDGDFKCDKDTCTGVPNIPNLTSPGTEFPVEYGSLVTVTCQSGSSLQGDGVITCQSGTEFVHEAEPSCVEKRCTGLPPHIDHITTTTSFPTAHSTVVTVLCDPASGAQLRGDSSITCDDKTSFTFEETPRCNEQGKCTELPPNCYLATNSIFPVPAGTQIMVMCETGTTHTSGDSVVTCVTDDQYTFQQSMPTCSIDTCSDLPDIYNLITDTPFPVDYGTTVRVSCLARYTLVGDDAITCVKGRTFLVENAMPGCQLDECTELPNLPNIKTNTTFPVVVGTVVELWCIPGYTLQGDSQITCLNGKEYLISSPPSCQVSFFFS